MRKSLYLIIFIALFPIFWSCEDDDYSSDKNLELSFSSDTISFDTIFTKIGSATKQFKIYNKNTNSLLIESIELMNPTESGFRMNIDGIKGTKISSVEILKKDSLFGFVEVTIDPKVSTSMLIRDSIKFVANGNVQYLQLEAIGQDVYIWKGESVTSDSVLTNTKPFLIYDSLVVKEGVILNIEEGTKFFLKKDASIRIHGTLLSKGSVEKPIVFRGARFDNVEANIPYDNVPGQWGGIYFYSKSYNNHLENMFVRNAVKGITFYSSNPQQKKAILINTIVHNTSQYGVLAINSNIDAQNCLFSNSRGVALALQGGEYSFLHCAVANYYRWSSRTIESLVLCNYFDNGLAVPLTKCDFINSIVYGSASEELLLDDYTNATFNYQFQNCLVKTKETSNSHFVNTVWNTDPLFKDLNTGRNYLYNFELQESSPAINKADKSYSLIVPFDLKGRSRLSDSNPDIGCYEWSK